LALSEYQATHTQASQDLAATQARLKSAEGDQAFWEKMANEAETAKSALAAKLAELQEVGAVQPATTVISFVAAGAQASQEVELDEADTRAGQVPGKTLTSCETATWDRTTHCGKASSKRR